MPNFQVKVIFGCRSRIRRQIFDPDRFDLDTAPQRYVRKVGRKLRFTWEYTEISSLAGNVP